MRFFVLFAACATLTACATGNDVDGFGGHGATGPGGAAAGGGPAGGSSAGGASAGGAGSVGGGPSDGGGGGAPSAGGGGEGGSAPGPGVLIFSEYVEGSGNNKAVEIANIGGAAVPLDDCVINRYQNGASTPLGTVLALDATTLAPGATWVLCNSQFAQSSLCDQTSGDLQHSGNDVVELSCGGQTRDVIGRIGEDAVWGTSPTITQDATLRRLCSVTSGDTDGADPFEPADEWSGFPLDTFSDLGQYLCP